MERIEAIFMKLQIIVALLLTFSPVLAFAKPRSATVHMRPQLFHDRAPKAHNHGSKAHLGA